MIEIKSNIPEEKRKKIELEALKEFSRFGYENGSTNKITKSCNISKGILFHYFKNKKNLYLYILDKSLKKMTSEVIKKIKTGTYKDYFDYIIKKFIYKCETSIKNPMEYKIILDSYLLNDESIKPEVLAIYKEIENIRNSFYSQYNPPTLAPDRLKNKKLENKYIETIDILLEGLQKKYLEIYKGQFEEFIKYRDEITGELESYLDIIKTGIYN